VKKMSSAKIIVQTVQKGGAGKTTNNGITGYILAKEYKKKVLLVDLDPQANLTEMMTGMDSEEFEDQTILEALIKLDARPFIYPISENLHILPSDENMGLFPRYIISRYYQRDDQGRPIIDELGDIVISQEAGTVLKKTLSTVRDIYDYILIDTPPGLSDQVANALIAAAGCVITYQTSPFCFTAVRRLLETIKACQESSNPGLRVLGILASLVDRRRSDSSAYLRLAKEKYGEDALFKTVITSKAAIGRLPVYGFEDDNSELKEALKKHRLFVEELLDREANGYQLEITEEMLSRDEEEEIEEEMLP
jgi:chromosome partitioning protein